MKRTAMALAAAAVALLTSTASAQSGRPVTLGISAGAAIPMGDFADAYNTGYNGTVSVGFNSLGSPVGLRVDGMYNKFGGRDDVAIQTDARIIGANANLVYSLPGQGIRPYLIGGGGIYGLKTDVPNSEQITDFGINGGIGAAFPLSGFNTFIEARLHHVFTENQAMQFIPVTFGISF